MSIINKSCTQANIVKLNKVLKNIKNQQEKNKIINQFNNHMGKIADICTKDFLSDWILKESFIKKLHKIHYPIWYKLYKEIAWKWKIVIMIPWNYKTIENFTRVKVKDTKYEMSKLIDNYNKKINITDNKFNFITKTIINLFKIHPFWDGNWTIISIIYDLLLINNNLKPVFLKWLYEDINKKKEIYNSIELSIKNNDISYFIKTIN